MVNEVILGCVGFGMFILGFYWGYMFGLIQKDDKNEIDLQNN